MENWSEWCFKTLHGKNNKSSNATCYISTKNNLFEFLDKVCFIEGRRTSQSPPRRDNFVWVTYFLLILGTRCDVRADPSLDILHFVLESSRLMKCLTALPDLKLETQRQIKPFFTTNTLHVWLRSMVLPYLSTTVFADQLAKGTAQI